MGITVLSLFDGMSCGQIALKELGIKVDKYYASEIDKHAIKQTMLNFPDTIQLGSVTEVDARKLGHIDLLIGGSPCTNFSFAGRRNGMNTTTNEEIYTLDRYLELKRQGFEFDGESFLFWEYMRILGEVRETNPDVLFFLENVEMGEKWESVLTKSIGIPGVHINSALVSAQNRRRIYWTNIKTKTEGLFGWVVPDIPQPEDRGIMLADMLEDEVDGKYYLKDEVVDKLLANGVKRCGINVSVSLLVGTGYLSPPHLKTRLPALSRATTRATAATHTRGNMCSNTKIVILTNKGYRIKKKDKVECLRACNPHKGVGKFEIEYLMEYDELQDCDNHVQ